MFFRSISSVTLFAVFVCVLFVSLPAYAGNPYGDYTREAEDLRDIQSGLKATTDAIDTTRRYLVRSKKFLETVPPGPERDRLMKALRFSSNKLSKTTRNLRKTTAALSNYTKPLDAYEYVHQLNDQYRSDQKELGDLAANLRLIGESMSKYGEKVPVIGNFVATYGEITKGMIDMTSATSKNIEKFRNDNAIGQGSYNTGAVREQNKALERDHPRLSSETFLPKGPEWLYETSGYPPVQLIWDDEGKSFYKVPKGIDARAIYKDSTESGKRPDPFRLTRLCETYDKVQLRQKAADDIYKLMTQFSLDERFRDVYRDIFRDFRSDFAGKTFSLAEMRKNYVYNGRFFQNMQQFLGTLYENFQGEDEGFDKARSILEGLAKKHGIKSILDQIKGDGTTGPFNADGTYVEDDDFTGVITRFVIKGTKLTGNMTSKNKASGDHVSARVTGTYDPNTQTIKGKISGTMVSGKESYSLYGSFKGKYDETKYEGTLYKYFEGTFKTRYGEHNKMSGDFTAIKVK